MNKTINISLGKQFFHIDEEAFAILKNYLDAIKSYLINEEGRDEILADVEARIAELFAEKLQSEREVVQVAEVERVIKVMGQPSDYKVDQDETNYTNSDHAYQKQTEYTNGSKKFYRDEEKNLLGGVCAGLAHNLGIDILWMRIIWVVLFFLSYGTFTILYLVLWIVVPAARTTAQKLAMMGEPVNISNIEKKVKENAEKAANYAKNFDYGKAAQNGKSTVTRFVDKLISIVSRIANVLAKIIGFIIVLASGFALISLIISLLSFGSISIFGFADFNFSNEGPFVFDAPIWFQMLVIFLIATVPVYFLFLAGLKIINSNLKLFKARTVVSLLVLWFLAIASMVFLGIKKELASNIKSEVVEINEIPMATSDTLSVKMIPNLNYTDHIYRSSTSSIKYDSQLQEDVLVGTSIYLSFKPSLDSVPKIRISKKATGETNEDARNNANNITYNYKFAKNELLLDSYFTGDLELKDEKLKLYVVVFLPENIYFEGDKSLSTFKDWEGYDNLDFYNEPNAIYQIKDSELICLSCQEDKPKNQTDE